MLEEGAAASARRRISVSLRGRDGQPAIFLPDYEVEFADQTAGPIIHEGRCFLFGQVVSMGSYRSAGSEEIYVFNEAEPVA